MNIAYLKIWRFWLIQLCCHHCQNKTNLGRYWNYFIGTNCYLLCFGTKSGELFVLFNSPEKNYHKVGSVYACPSNSANRFEKNIINLFWTMVTNVEPPPPQDGDFEGQWSFLVSSVYLYNTSCLIRKYLITSIFTLQTSGYHVSFLFRYRWGNAVPDIQVTCTRQKMILVLASGCSA